MKDDDMKALAAGVMAWTVAIPAVKIAGNGVASNEGYFAKIVALGVGAGIAACTTPLLGSMMGWRTSNERVRGIALALGAAQVVDGLVHLFNPTFYNNDHRVGIACAGNIFYGAGLLGIFSCFM